MLARGEGPAGAVGWRNGQAGGAKRRDALSRTGTSVGRVMKLSNFLYFGDFIAIPAAILLLAAAAIYERGLAGAGAWLGWFVVGLLVWTLVEYVVHRWVYHAIPFFEKFHDAHHDDPTALIGVPSFISSGLILSVFFLPLLFTVGVVVAGYAGYMLVHHASHHWTLEPGSLLYRARVQHMAHHYNDAPGNYGVVTSFWDQVFSTNVDRRRRAARS
jgi:sterol desaturase/sphingolipid hydroxylase (fatty acid hydroxylase superfamily)